MENEGTYIAIFHLPEPARITVGKLGTFDFRPSYYLYAGSAQKNLSARLARHADPTKPCHWHIDYLAARATLIGSITVPAPRQHECRLAQQMHALYQTPIPHFGSSDCKCPTHLFYTPDLLQLPSTE